MSVSAPPVNAPRSRWTAIASRLDAYERLVRLDKPIGTLLLLWPTLSALWFASVGRPSVAHLIVFGMGTLLMRSAGCAMNDWADRHFDPHVKRTAARPLATGEIPGWEALAVAAALAFCAFLLVLTTNRATILLSFMSESRRLVNARMKRELRVRLRYPSPLALLREVAPRDLKRQLALPL